MKESISTSEVFVPIVGWEDTHQVSNKGTVLSRGRRLKPFLNNGYKMLNLKAKGRAKLVYVHRLVGLHFLPHLGDNKQLFICHREDIRDRCSLEHLFIGTRSDNMRDAWQNGRWEGRITGNAHTISLNF